MNRPLFNLRLGDHPEEFRYLVLALQRQGSRQLNDLYSQVGLTNSQAEAIEVVGTFGPLTTKEVGQYLVCESGSPSRLLSSLAAKGLTVTSRPEGDRRATLHALSPQGRESLTDVRRLKREFEADLQQMMLVAGEEHQGNTLGQLAALLVDPQLKQAMTNRFPQLFR